MDATEMLLGAASEMIFSVAEADNCCPVAHQHSKRVVLDQCYGKAQPRQHSKRPRIIDKLSHISHYISPLLAGIPGLHIRLSSLQLALQE